MCSAQIEASLLHRPGRPEPASIPCVPTALSQRHHPDANKGLKEYPSKAFKGDTHEINKCVKLVSMIMFPNFLTPELKKNKVGPQLRILHEISSTGSRGLESEIQVPNKIFMFAIVSKVGV